MDFGPWIPGSIILDKFCMVYILIFKDPINFYAITLHKRITGSGDSPSEGGSVIWPSQHCCSAGVSTFKNVCLVLDGDVENQLCTDADWGWSYDDWET